MSATAGHTDGWSFCDGILPDVSRSFALIIPKCPEPLDRALCVAYLMCRVADTVEDDASLNDDRRSILYDALLSAVNEPGDLARARVFRDAWPAVPGDAYGRLIEGFDLVLSAYGSLAAGLRAPIRTCVHEMVAGMRHVRPVETAGGIAFLCRDLDELDRYCHYVAGTVGVMSTALFLSRLGPRGFTPTPQWREDGRRLGLGLQMTNIIKDCRVDAARGVSFIPARCVDPNRSSYQLDPVGFSDLTRRAIGHLDAGLQYVLAIPTDETGIRAFLLGSLLPAVATLEVAAPGTEYHPKIDRAKMGEIFTLIDHHIADNEALAARYTEHRRRTLAALAQQRG